MLEGTGAGTFLQISGKASDTINDEEIAGLMDGLFGLDDPDLGRGFGQYCQAADHRFRLVKQ